MFMGLVLEVASCTSVYKQAPEQTYLTVFLCFYIYIQIGTKTNLLNGGLVAYTHGLGV